MSRHSAIRFVGIGLTAGFFSALFGVGGGIVMVPLLLTIAGFGAKEAAATSLAAIFFTAIFGTARYAWSGHVHWASALLIGAPAVLGGLAGTRLHRRSSADQLTYLFAALLAVVGVRLLVC